MVLREMGFYEVNTWPFHNWHFLIFLLIDEKAMLAIGVASEHSMHCAYTYSRGWMEESALL